MRDWNVVATIHDGGFRRACRLVSLEGELSRTEFYNIVVMKVLDVDAFLARLETLWSQSRSFPEVVAHVRPVRESFRFQSPEEFEAKAQELALGLAESLAGKTFHVRIHRRGLKGTLSTKDEERSLAAAVLARLSASGASARVAFDDPDAVLAVDSVGDRAGMTPVDPRGPPALSVPRPRLSPGRGLPTRRITSASERTRSKSGNNL